MLPDNNATSQQNKAAPTQQSSAKLHQATMHGDTKKKENTNSKTSQH
jgi:hypothetical protein